MSGSMVTWSSVENSSVGGSSGVGWGSVPEGCALMNVSNIVPWDNHHNLIPKRVEVIVNILCMGILLPLCFLLSFSTNVVNMLVFYKHGMGERINVCLFSLSLLDLIYVAAAYGFNSDVLYNLAVGKANEVNAFRIFFVNNGLIGLLGAGSASQVVSTVIAIERCLCVTRPLLVKSLLSAKKTAILLWSVSLLIIAGAFVTGMRYTIKCVFDATDGTTHFQFFPNQFYLQNKSIIHILGGVFYGSLLPGVCMICVTACTVVIVVKIKKLSVWRESVTSASDSLSSRDLAVTRMIVGTSVLFVVCIVPSIAVRVMLVLAPGLRLGGRYENLYSVFMRIFYVSSVINSSFNFFVYYLYGSKFRQTLQQLFICCTRYPDSYCNTKHGELKKKVATSKKSEIN